MSDCRRTADRLASYTDDALPLVERADVERHLEACPPCRIAAAREQGGRTLLRQRAERLKHEPLPPGLRTRCEAMARAHAAGGGMPLWSRGFLRGAVAAVVIILAAVALFSFGTHRSNTLLAAQLTADHVKCFRVFAEPGARAVDAHELEESLENRYGWDVHVPPSSAADGIQLIGARRCLYADGTIPHVMYRVHGQDVSLYMLEGVQRPAAELTTLGHHSRIWSHGATTYVMVSSASAHDVDRAADYVMQEAH